jgi:SAM-dependent methyltransferase
MRLNSMPFFDEVVTESNRGTEFAYDINLFFCEECASVQTQHDVNLQAYYQNYQYVASHSLFARSYMQALVDYCCRNLGLQPGSRVIEVGAADGYLLSLFNANGAKTIGFEAADNLCALARDKGIYVINELFAKESLHLIPTEFRPAHLIVLLHTFDHLYDPAPFLDSVRQVLDPKRGVLLIECHDLHDIHEKREVALFGHEHATYLHYGSMSRFLESHGFRVIDYNFLPKEICRGSSMLIAAVIEGSELESVPYLSSFESPGLDSLSTFIEFEATVRESFKCLYQYVENGKSRGKRFAGYGGWGRGITTLAIAGLGPEQLEFVVDGNSKLHGCFTPVSSIPIVGPKAVTKEVVDEVIVFNYAYLDEIKDALSSFIADGGVIMSVIDLLKCGKV